MRQGLLNRQAHQAHCLTPCAPVPSVVRQPVYHIDLRRPNVQAQGIAKDILSRQAQNIEGDPLQFLEVTEQYWKALRLSKDEPEKKGPTVVTVSPQGTLGEPDFDVVVCGGTLGLMLAATLQRRGHRVAVVDKRLIQGRTQEWNISKGELMALAEVGLLSEAELQSCIDTEFNPVRVGFSGGPQLWVNDCLNLGVSPRKLLDLIKAKFVEAGGVLMENHSFRRAEVMPNQGVRLTLTVHPSGSPGAALGPGDVNRPNGLGGNSSNLAPPFTPVTSTGITPSPERQGRRNMQLGCRLFLDCMGHYSDVVKQMRGRAKPDGMCLVVGSCAEGFPTGNNTFGDLLYTIGNAQNDMQMFWEAFPAENGRARTTYMFAYSDAEPSRPSFEALLDQYFTELEKYQGVPAQQLKFKRVLFGGFPCWSDGPLQPQWDHIMQIGDASATQSPLSFGGFGAMLRHLGRLTEGVDDALRCGALSRDELRALHPYQPALNCTWLFQRAMSVGPGQLATDAAAAAAASLPAAAPLPSSNGSRKAAAATLPNGALAPPPASWFHLPADHVNVVLGVNFAVMNVLGDRVLRPFLQDTIQLLPLAATMTGMMLANPLAISRVLLQVGPKNLSSWFGHFFALVAYTTLHTLSTPLRNWVRTTAATSQNQPDAQPVQMWSKDGRAQVAGASLRHSTSAGRSRDGYLLRRLLDAWEVGSGSDYNYHKSEQPLEPPSNTMFAAPEPPAAKAAGAATPIPAGYSGSETLPVTAPVPVPVPVHMAMTASPQQESRVTM